MNKTEAIKAMLDGKKVCLDGWDEGTFLMFDGDAFRNERGYATDIFDFSIEGWKLYEEPKKKVKKWLWLISVPRGTEPERITSCFYPDVSSVEAGILYSCKTIKKLDGTNGTWNSEIEVEE